MNQMADKRLLVFLIFSPICNWYLFLGVKFQLQVPYKSCPIFPTKRIIGLDKNTWTLVYDIMAIKEHINGFFKPEVVTFRKSYFK